MDLTHELIKSLGAPLYRFFLARFSTTASEDLVQEVFTRLVISLRNHYDPTKGTPEALAWGIALNIQKESFRTNRRLPEFRPESPEQTAPAEKAIEFQALRQAVSKLAPSEATVMQLVLADLGITEIAQHLGVPDGTVKSHIHRAKQNLRLLLGERD